MLNLDTHIVIDALRGELKPRERVLLSQRQWSISAIVLWELAKLAQLGRIEIDMESRELAQSLARIHVWPIDLAVCRRISQLDFRSDPADEIIAATSLVHNVPLLTRDRRMRRSSLVPLA
jgi:PIN domain nuclease of toxin-antitoxin system